VNYSAFGRGFVWRFVLDVANEESGRTKVAAFGVAICLCFVLSVFFFAGVLADGNDECVITIASRINPNTASIGSLMRLPGIGPSRASDIVEYRSNCGRQKAFDCADDMQVIKGIGPKTVEKMKLLLCFD
jgi:competence ComEA-like helix-hairpin-helix protein